MILAQEFNRQRAITWSLLCMLFVFFSVGSSGAETLWDPVFGGYISDGSGLTTGTTLKVLVTPSTQLTLSSSHIDSTEGRLSFSGGSGGGLFDFLPQASSSGTVEVEEESSYSLETYLTALVTRRGENGLYYLEGSRSISLNGNREKLSVGGWFSAEQVSPAGTIAFDSLHDAVLEYSSPGLAMDEILSREDLTSTTAGRMETTMPPAGAVTPVAGETTTAAAAGAETAAEMETAAAGAETPMTPEAPGTALTEEKQKELLLRYFNRFLQNLFSAP